MKKISEIITESEIASWETSIPVIISAQTGSGKSFFIKNKLYRYAKKHNKRILLLVHRLNCLSQFDIELQRKGKFDVIKISDYQCLENGFDNEWMNKYAYIVCDEFHYFVEDSNFNYTTDISYKKIMETSATKIFISATPINICGYICKENKDARVYTVPSDYSYIDNLYMCNTENATDEFVKELILTKTKGIMFINNLDVAYNLYKKYSDIALFNCSKSSKYYKYVDEDKVNDMLQKEKFCEQLLITTTCMDTGVNIVDSKLQNIYLDIKYVDEIVQCIGRKRITKQTDKLNIWVKNYQSQDFGRLKGTINAQLSRAYELLNIGEAAYKEKYTRKPDPAHIVYVDDNDGHYEINPLMKFKKESDIDMCNQIIKLGNNGFAKILSMYLGFTPFEIKSDKRIDYLEAHVNEVMLTLSDREEFIKTMNFKSNGKLLKSKNSINQQLLDHGIPYSIYEFQTSRSTNGQKEKFKYAWKIIKN